ncbi:hypothetical protein HDU98_000294 [Podochytrium sp. JEL0797]|nr:hypothetical protein HDU98_000294 [Podochytrium sp. JEL0797]
MDSSDSDDDHVPMPAPPQKQKPKQPEEPPPPDWSKRLQMVENASLKGDRLIMSPTVLSEIIHLSGPNHALPSPLFFQLTCASGTKAYGSVREFTAAQDHIVEVSPALAERLRGGGGNGADGVESKGKQAVVEMDVELQDEDDVASLVELDCLVECVALPKCEYLKIAPLEATYLEIPDLRALLESHLRRTYSSVSLGTILSVPMHHHNYNGQEQMHRFLITECKPAQTCSCIDTDINLDVVPLVVGGVAGEAVRRKFMLCGGGGGGGVQEVVLVQEVGGVEVKGEVRGLVGVGESVFYRVRNMAGGGKGVGRYEIRVAAVTGTGGGSGSSSGGGGGGGDCDLFVSTRAFEKPGKMEHDYFNVDEGESAVQFEMGGREQDEDVPFIFVGVEGYSAPSGTCSFRLTVSWTKLDAATSIANSTTEPTEFLDTHHGLLIIPEGHTQCPTCYQNIPSRTFPMHEAFCSRNNAVCNRCRTAGTTPFVFQRDQLANHWHCDECAVVGTLSQGTKHVGRMHSMMECVCGEGLELAQVAGHKGKQCPERLILCRYCRLRVRAGKKSTVVKDLYAGLDLSEHESECGSRTIECVKCKASVQLKDVQMHAQFHEIKKQNQQTPPLCPNTQCANRPTPQYPNPLGLCQPCFAPFWSPRHDPGNQKLISKLVGVYHSQLTMGCNHSWCTNAYCKTGKKEVEGMDPTGAAVVAFEVLKRSKLFVGGGRGEYSLCVAEAKTARRRVEAEKVAEMGFHVSWAVKALEECADDSGKAISWLLQNAPKE